MVAAVPSESPEKQSARWHPIYNSLREAIVAHRIQPGTKLPEDELAAIYAVSRTVIRVALHALAQDRLVRLELNRGAFVAQPSIKEAREVFDARALIEPEVALLAAEIIKPKDIALLREKIDQESTAWREQRRGETVQIAGQFHIAIAEIANHSVFTQMVRDLLAHASLIQSLYGKRGEGDFKGPTHAEILEALERRDGKEAHRLMKSHINTLTMQLELNQPSAQPTKLADILG